MAPLMASVFGTVPPRPAYGTGADAVPMHRAAPLGRGRLAALAALAVGLLSASMPAGAAVAPAGDAVNVREMGARGDGKADDTRAFLDAVAHAAEEKRHVYVPRGTYLLSRPIDLKDMALCGPEAGAWPADIDSLPVLVPAHRDKPGIVLGAGGSLSGVCIRYDWKAEPAEGPPAVWITGIGAYVHNVKVMYAWDGILTDGTSNVGRLNIENAFLVAIRNVGVRVTGTWDVPALRNIEVWNAGPVPRGLEKGVGFLLGKNDLIRVTDCFAFAMRYGFLLQEEIPGCTIKGGTWGVMTGCSTDFCGTGIAVQGEHTVSITGGTFWDHAEGLVVEGAKARVRLNGAELKSNGAPAIVVRDSDHVVVAGCSILRTMDGFTPPAVLLEGGRTLLGDNHIEALSAGVQLGKGVRGAVVRGNLMDTHGKPYVVNEAGPGAQVLLEGNLEWKSTGSAALPAAPR